MAFSPTPPSSLARFYNVISKDKGFGIAPHHIPVCQGLEDTRIHNLMLVGPPGCLSGDTKLNLRRGKRNHGRAITIRDAYMKLNGIPTGAAPWKLKSAVNYLPALKEDRIGYHRVVDIVCSGRKHTFTIKASNGKLLRVTEEHPFKVPEGTEGADREGFKQLKDLRVGDRIIVRSREKYQGGRKPNKKRVAIYGVIHHPHAWRKIVCGKDYGRQSRARLAYEAAGNDLSLDEFIRILRTDPERAKTLTYLPREAEVHHIDENPLNDDPRNLEVILAETHLREHAHEKQKNFGDVLYKEATITSIEPYGEEMTFDVVMAEPYRNYVAHDFVVHNTGKSYLLDYIYPLYELTRDPSLTILAVSAGEALMQGFQNAVMQTIEWDKTFQTFYPNIKPAKEHGWSTAQGMCVTGHKIGDPDTSYWAGGLTSKVLTGKHGRLLIFDDLHDYTNSATVEQREQVKARYYSQLLGRADPRGARKILAGRRWAKDDLYGHLLGSGDWVVLQTPAQREGQRALYADVFVPHGMVNVFTETLKPVEQNDQYIRYKAFYGFDPTGEGFYWPGSEQKRREYFAVKRGQPNAAETIYNCNPKSGEEDIFTEEDFRFRYAPPEGLEQGLASPAVVTFLEANGRRVAQAWDTAFGQSASSANTVAITGLLVPCNEWHCGEDPQIVGPCDHHLDVYVLDVMVKKMDFRDLALNLRVQHQKWGPRPVLVEDRASGISLIQTFKGTDIPVKGLKVPEGKVARALNGVGGGAASVQGWFRQGRVKVPADATWLQAWMNELMEFSGDKSARSDQFDATVHLVTYAIQKSVSAARLPSIPTAITSTIPPSPLDELSERLSLKAAYNPFLNCCKLCIRRDLSGHCFIMGRRVMEIETCAEWADTLGEGED